MQRSNLISLLVLVFFFCITCNRHKSSYEGKLRVLIGASPATLDPRFATDAYGMRITSLIFNSLVEVSENLKLQGDAAEKWEYKDNVYRFFLRPNIYFSNGRKLSKADIEYSFQFYKSPKSPFHTGLKNIFKVIVTKNENGGFIIDLVLSSFSAKLLSEDLRTIKLLPSLEIQKDEDAFKRKPFGTGSFALKEIKPNRIHLIANKKNSYLPPKIDELTFFIVRDDFTRFQKMLNEEIDIAQAEIPSEKIKYFENDSKKFDVFKFPGLSFSYLLLNLKEKPFNDSGFRKHLSMSLNREKIIRHKLEGLAQPANSILSPENPFYYSGLPRLEWNMKVADIYFKKLKFPSKIVLKTSNSPSAVEMGKIISHQLGQVGLNVELQSYEWGTYYADVNKGQFQMATMNWIGVIDPDIYRFSLHSQEKPPGRNRGAYFNPRFDKLVEDGLKASDLKNRKKIYHEVQKILLEDLPIIPLWHNTQVVIAHKRVKNFTPARNGGYLPFRTLELINEY